MAIIKNNILTENLSGKLGDLVFRKRKDGQTVVARAPQKRSRNNRSLQDNIKLDFKEAVRYAKAVINNPDAKRDYQLKTSRGNTAYNIAVADAMKPPEIKSIKVMDNKRKHSVKIIVEAIDDFEVKSVWITICNPDGEVLISGPAER